MSTAPRTITLLAAIGLLALTGCQPTYTDYGDFVQTPKPLVTATEYRMAPPDSIHIGSKRVREIDGVTQQIRPDGMVSLPLVGEVFAAGKTPMELADEIEAHAQLYYEDADVAVRVVDYQSKKIYVFGEVGRSGPYSYDGTNTVFRTLALAQPNRLANPSKVQILRPNPDGTFRRKMTIDFDKMVKSGDTSLDAVLEENDVIYVPPNALASIGLACRQLLLPILPMSEVVNGPVSMHNDLQSVQSTP
ncbi:polysaccharide biosynthesis/export family protein [Mucisphaera calidilacus]|nr:polysaccharide biosynthesis/export family protein [Mucisphaera calidilacus]